MDQVAPFRTGSNASLSSFSGCCVSCRGTRGSVGSDATGVNGVSPDRKESVSSTASAAASNPLHRQTSHGPPHQCLCTLLQRARRQDSIGTNPSPSGLDLCFSTQQGHRETDEASVANGDAIEAMSISTDRDHRDHRSLLAHGPAPPSPMLDRFCRSIYRDENPNVWVSSMTSSTTIAVEDAMDLDANDEEPLGNFANYTFATPEWVRQNNNSTAPSLTPSSASNGASNGHGEEKP